MTLIAVLMVEEGGEMPLPAKFLAQKHQDLSAYVRWKGKLVSVFPALRRQRQELVWSLGPACPV